MTAETLWGVGTAVGAMLGGAGASVVVIESLRRRPLRSSVLIQRWSTWAVLAVMWIVALSHPLAMIVMLALIGTLSAGEYSRLAGLTGADRILLLVSPVMALTALSAGINPGAVLASAALIGTVAPILGQDIAQGPRRIGLFALGSLVAVLPVGAIWLLATSSTGLVLALLFGVALSDVLAFTVGSALGTKRLAPVLSPNKTWFGVVGNLLGAALGVFAASLITPIGAGAGVVMSLTVALGSIWGDLLESMIKRHAGVKDAGSLLPGFGGILDRFDSLVVAAPLLMVAALAMEGVA